MQDYSIQQLAEVLGADMPDDNDFLQQQINGINTLRGATETQLSFFTNSKYKAELLGTQAGVVLIAEEYRDLIPEKALVVKNPHAAFARAAQLFDSTPAVAVGIADSAQIHPSARLGRGVSVAANAVIGAGVVLGDEVQIGANTVVGESSVLGDGCIIYPNVTLYHDIQLGCDVVIHSNTVVGSDGFGYANDNGQWLAIPQIGRVVVGDDTHIGASCTIDRGALEDTVIGQNVIIDDQVHIAHNVEIGDHSCICGATGIAGSAKIGKYVVIAGSCAINGHISITDKVQITGNSMVTNDITEAGVYSSGQPVTPNSVWRKNTVRARQLDDLFSRVKRIEKAIKD